MVGVGGGVRLAVPAARRRAGDIAHQLRELLGDEPVHGGGVRQADVPLDEARHPGHREDSVGDEPHDLLVRPEDRFLGRRSALASGAIRPWARPFTGRPTNGQDRGSSFPCQVTSRLRTMSRAEQRDATRQRIVEAAIETFAEHGFGASTP